MQFKRGLTLVEILTVLSIGTMLISISMPAVSMVRRQAQSMKGMNNIRQIVLGVNIYATDNQGRYPDSVTTLRHQDESWHWQDPRMMAACKARSSRYHRSMSAYLRGYFLDADVLTCPSSPSRTDRLQEAWEAGDNWDHPDSSYDADLLFGSYTFLWNYLAFESETQTVFHGARTQADRRQSKILVTDYLGFDHFSSPGTFLSCETFKPSGIASGTDVSSDFWTLEGSENSMSQFDRIKLKAGYVDGSVLFYYPTETQSLEVSIKADGSEPYPAGLGWGPGCFFVPK